MIISHETRGSCGCGMWRLRITTARSIESLKRLACSCSFCRKVDAWYFLDEAAEVTFLAMPSDYIAISIGQSSSVNISCRRCGVYIGSAWREIDPARFCVNGRILDLKAESPPTPLLGDIHASSPFDSRLVARLPRCFAELKVTPGTG